MTTRGKAVFPGFTLAASILGLAMVAVPSSAATPPAMTLVTSDGYSVAFDSTGTVTYGGLCTATLCHTTVVVGNGANGYASGLIVWFGTVGTFTGSITGQTKPAVVSPEIDILISQLQNTGASSATVTISWTDVGFTVGESPATMNITTNGSEPAAPTTLMSITQCGLRDRNTRRYCRYHWWRCYRQRTHSESLLHDERRDHHPSCNSRDTVQRFLASRYPAPATCSELHRSGRRHGRHAVQRCSLRHRWRSRRTASRSRAVRFLRCSSTCQRVRSLVPPLPPGR